MKKFMLAFAGVAALSGSVFGRDPVDWVNTEIGTISHMLVPCFQTVQLPNAMLRVLPPYRDFTDDRVRAVFLQTPDHRGPQVFAVHPFSGKADRLGVSWSGTWDAPHSTPYSYDVKYVAAATIGGRPLAGTAIAHSSVTSGETLRLEMTAE